MRFIIERKIKGYQVKIVHKHDDFEIIHVLFKTYKEAVKEGIGQLKFNRLLIYNNYMTLKIARKVLLIERSLGTQ